MAWPHYRPTVSVVDVLEQACYQGVVEWVEEHDGVISGDTSKYRHIREIQEAAHANGCGDGDGYGSGYGSGYGDGYGYGDGDEDG